MNITPANNYQNNPSFGIKYRVDKSLRKDGIKKIPGRIYEILKDSQLVRELDKYCPDSTIELEGLYANGIEISIQPAKNLFTRKTCYGSVETYSESIRKSFVTGHPSWLIHLTSKKSSIVNAVEIYSKLEKEFLQPLKEWIDDGALKNFDNLRAESKKALDILERNQALEMDAKRELGFFAKLFGKK